MKVGLMWFDDDAGCDLSRKVGRAARHYQRKFGRKPNVCYVHPSLLEGGAPRVGSVRVASLASMLRHHFWVGEEETGH